ncbi:MAG: hypothetical protein ACYSR0_13230, partial [Planctomycetota bacterium]
EQADGGDAAGGVADTGRVSPWADKDKGDVYESVAGDGGEGTIFCVGSCLVDPDGSGPGGRGGADSPEGIGIGRQDARCGPFTWILSLQDTMAT